MHLLAHGLWSSALWPLKILSLVTTISKEAVTSQNQYKTHYICYFSNEHVNILKLHDTQLHFMNRLD